MTYEQIKEALKKRYGEITDRGCNVNGKWFSLAEVLEIIKKLESE